MHDEPQVVWKDGVRLVLDDEIHDPLSHILRALLEIKREQKENTKLLHDAVERVKALAEQL